MCVHVLVASDQMCKWNADMWLPCRKLCANSLCWVFLIYESIATVGESRVWWRADFQSGSRVLKKGVLNLFLSISMAYNVISCQKVAENTQILKIAKFAM